MNAYKEMLKSGKVKKLNFNDGINEEDFINLNIFSILIQENTIVWNFLRKFAYGDNMKIDFETNFNYFKLKEIDNPNKYIFELSMEAIACLNKIFRNFGVVKKNSDEIKTKGDLSSDFLK